jgi:hypothetical protein
MTSTADALEIMTIVAACHHRTAPRTDDHQAALATATIWAELIHPYQLAQTDLLEAVKRRARFHTEAPEPADIIQIARQIRSERANTTIGIEHDPPDHPYRQEHPTHQHKQEYPGDSKAAPDPAPYPEHWTAEQRVTAYWYALRQHATPTSGNSWEALLKQAQDHAAARKAQP